MKYAALFVALLSALVLSIALSGAAAANVDGWVRVQSSEKTVTATNTGTEYANCPTGKVPLGGGVEFTGGVAGDATASVSIPQTDSWRVTVDNAGGSSSVYFTVWAVCATPGS